MPLRMQISSAAVIIWSAKLAGFLFYRASKREDARLEELLSTVPGTSECVCSLCYMDALLLYTNILDAIFLS
jgi:steroid 5-alpha reductase family enzyme